MAFANILIVIALTLVLPVGRTSRCDIAEINHVHEVDGTVRFTQLIAWEWLPDLREYHAQDWCYVESWSATETILTYRNRERVGQVRFKIYRETWTTNEPELEDRRVFHDRYRVKVLQQ